MAESLPQVTLQKKNEVQQASSGESKPKEESSGVETPVFNAGNSTSTTSAKSTSIMSGSDETKVASSDNASVFGSASSSVTEDDNVFPWQPKEKTYTAGEYQVKKVVDSVFMGIRPRYQELLDSALPVQEVEGTKNPDTPIIQVQTAHETKFSEKVWEKIDSDVNTNFNKFIHDEFDKYGIKPRELEHAKRIKARELIGELRARKITYSQFQDRLKEVMSADEAAKNIVNNPDNADGETRYYAAIIDATAYAGVEQIEGKNPEETRKLRENCVKEHVENIHKRQRELSEKVAEAIPETFSKEDAEKVLKASGKYSDYSTDNMTKHVADSHYSNEFKEEIGKIADKIVKENVEYQKKFIKNFWESPKGQIIIKRVKEAIHDLREAREEYYETQKKVEIATEEAEAAREQAEIAQAEVKRAKKKAANILSELGVKMKDMMNIAYHKFFKKIIKNTSPKAYNELVYAKEQERKAYWAQWDADAAKDHAKLINSFAQKEMEFANAKMIALMRNVY